MGTTKILNEWWKELKLLSMSLGYKSRAYEKKRKGARRKVNMKMEAEKRHFS